MSTCKICGHNCKSVARHVIPAHNITAKEYYLTYVNSEVPNCETCGTPLTFNKMSAPYERFCSPECRQHKVKKI